MRAHESYFVPVRCRVESTRGIQAAGIIAMPFAAAVTHKVKEEK